MCEAKFKYMKRLWHNFGENLMNAVIYLCLSHLRFMHETQVWIMNYLLHTVPTLATNTIYNVNDCL